MGLLWQVMDPNSRMKFLKVKISADLLAKLGHPKIFEHVSHVEVYNIFQYDPQNFFLHSNISFPFSEGNWRDIPDFKKIVSGRHPVIKYFFLLHETQNSIECLLKLSKDVPFWPLLASKPNSLWALLPPVWLDPEFLHFILITNEESLPEIYDIFSNFASSTEILAQGDFQKEMSINSRVGPDFSERQIEITRFAFRNGYFNSPKNISAQDIAKNFGLSTAAITDHLRKATYCAMKYFFS